MLQGWVIAALSIAYLGVLFAIAWYGDRRADQGRSLIANPYVYSLSLAVYATSWTFYGSVGRAATSGVGFLPIYIGPTLVAVLWCVVVAKILAISKAERITSIADFIGSRYGKSALLAGLVAAIAVIGIVPYISLQLKAVSNSFTVLTSYPEIVMPARVGELPVLSDTTFYVALLLAAFSILFGARHLDAAERHEGMVAAIAFESIVKLAAFLALGVFVTFGIYGGFGDLFGQAAADERLAQLLAPFGGSGGDYASWAWLTVLSMFAILFLPRQFQVTIVENVDAGHLRQASWLFPLYLLAINLFVLPIAFGGLLKFPAGQVDADTFVLALPMAEGQQLLALAVFVGGLSAATGMVIVETVALSTMVSNDLVMPLLLRLGLLRAGEQRDVGKLLLAIRRGAIAMILLLGYAYFRFAGNAYALVAIGLISFAAVAQFAPAVFGGIYWRHGTRAGAIAGLAAGFAVWLYTLLLPSFAESGWLPASFLERGPWGIELLRPRALFGLAGLDQITHAMLWSMLANVGTYVAVSLAGHPDPATRAQAERFVEPAGAGAGPMAWRGATSVRDLEALLARFLGADRVRADFAAYALRRGAPSIDALAADAALVHFAETQLAGAIGSASARVMVSSVAKEEALGMDEVLSILDESSQAIAYSKELEEKSRALEAATAELRSANERLKELDHMKDDFVSTVSHELRTPLTSIRAMAELLIDRPGTPVEKREKCLSVILKEAERLTRLINQILDMAKIESGRMEWRPEPLDLCEVVSDAAAAAGALFTDKGVQLETHLPQAAPTVVGDRDRLIQVVVNLLSNAVKFSPARSGRVELALSLQSDRVRVDVTDNGRGIDPGDHAAVFEKFRQVGDTLTDKPQGTGLGLPISREIVRQFGGEMWVESALGQGARFSFTLPVAQPQGGS